MTRTMGEVATSPAVGDVVVLRNGHVRYTVTSFLERYVSGIATGEHELVRITRSQVRPEIPDQALAIRPEIWADLVRFAACSVETSS